MRLAAPKRADDLASCLAEISAGLLDIASEEELFAKVGEHLSYAAWELDGPVFRLRHTSWAELVGFALGKADQVVLTVNVDSVPSVPHFFSSRRFRRFPAMREFRENVVRSLCDARGRRLSDDALRILLEHSRHFDGVQGPLFVSGAPWGVLIVEWKDPSDADLDLFTVFGAQISAALELLAHRQGLIRANRELQAIRDLVRHPVEDGVGIFRPSLETVAIVTESDAASLFWVEPGNRIRLALHCGVPCAWAQGNVHGRDEIFQEVLSSMEATTIGPAEPDVPALALYPLVLEKRTRGILVLARHGTGRAYSRQEFFRAGLLASQLAVQLENAILLEEARRQYELISGLYRFSRQLARAREGELPLEDSLATLVANLGLMGAWLYVADEGGLALAASAGEAQAPAPEFIPADSDNPLALALRRRKVWYGPCGMAPDASSLLALPLVSSNQIVGCLAVSRKKGDIFRKRDVELLQSICVQIALAVQRSRLERSVRERVRQLRFLSEVGRITTSRRLERETLLPEFLSQAVERIGFDFGLAIADGRTYAYGKTPPEEVIEALRKHTESAFREGKAGAPTQVRWGEQTAHLAAVPARSVAGVQAVIGVVRRGLPISIQEIETLEAAGSNLGFALEDARRFEETRRSLDELELLLEVGQAVTSTPRLDELLRRTAETIDRLTGGTRTAILLFDPIQRRLRCEAISKEEGTSLRLGRLISCASQIVSRDPVVVEDASRASPGLRAVLEGFGVKAAIIVHMHILDEPIGCIAVLDETGPRKWPAASVERVRLISHQLAIAVANARLDADLRASHQELARAQQELVAKERLAALGELSAVVAHEVRNPLGVIFNSISSLRRLLHLEGDAATLFEIVEEEANRLDRIVNDLLEFARPHPANPSWVDVGALISSALATYPRLDDIELEVVADPDLPEIHADDRLVRQALLNLVQNAIHAMPKGGPLRVEARRADREGKRYVQIAVADGGPGIPEELRTKIFEPFFTTKATGSGLGLALVKRIVEAHGGRVLLHSVVGEGSTFILEFEAPERES